MKAGEWGNSNGYLSLGFCYYSGDGVNQDFGKAFNYFMKASDMNNPQAAFNIGIMYDGGQGVEKNDLKKFEYFSKAKSNFAFTIEKDFDHSL